MNAAVQDDFPLDLLGILSAGVPLEGLATTGTLSLVFGEIVNRIHRREVVATFSSVALGARLLTSLASWLVAGLGPICSAGVVIKSLSRSVLTGVGLGAVLGLSAENLLLEPGYSCLGGFEFSDELGDLGLLTANDFFEPLSLVLPGRLPFGSTGMLCPPVVCLSVELSTSASSRLSFRVCHCS